MRPAPHLLSAFAGTGCLLALGTGAASAADADATPRLLNPGESVTVLVSCDRLDGRAPAVLKATSPAFARGEVELKRVSKEEEDPRGGPAYRGRAELAATQELRTSDTSRRTSEWDVEGVCPGGEQWAAAFRVDQTPAERPSRPKDRPSGEPGTDGRGAADGPAGAGTDGMTPSVPDEEARGATEPHREQRDEAWAQEERTVSPAALAGGSAVLLAGVVGVACWKRRTAPSPPSQD